MAMAHPRKKVALGALALTLIVLSMLWLLPPARTASARARGALWLRAALSDDDRAWVAALLES